MKQTRRALLSVGAIFAAIGLLFALIGAGEYSACEELRNEGIGVQAVCSWKGDDDLWFAFEAKGKSWNLKSTYSTDFIHTGDEITVYYPIGHPEKARITDGWIWGTFLIMGSVFAVIGLGFIGWQWRSGYLLRSLQKNGQKVTAQVTQIRQLRSTSINGIHPYVVYAVCTHPYTGNEMKVKSHMLLSDPAPQLTDGTVEVLVDMMNERRYFMQIDDPFLD